MPHGKHVRKLIINTFNNVVIKTVLDEKYSGQAYIFDEDLIQLRIHRSRKHYKNVIKLSNLTGF